MKQSEVKPDYQFRIDDAKPGKVGLVYLGVTAWYSEYHLNEILERNRLETMFFEEALQFYLSQQ